MTAFPDRREVKSRRRRLAGGITGLLLDEMSERLADAAERVNITDVGIGESVAQLNRLVEEVTPLAAERHRGEVFELGARTAHV